MKKYKLLTAAFLAAALSAGAMPAKRAFFVYTQPDGSTVEAMPVGDEHSHYYVTRDGVKLLSDAEGTKRYVSTDAAGNIVLSPMAAVDADRRSAAAKAFIAGADNSKIVKALKRRTPSRVRKAATAATSNGPAGLGLFSGDYPRKGKVNSMIILVEYQDVKFSVPNPQEYFTRQANEKGFSSDGGTGSVRDYFLDQSNGQFDVNFKVVGPLTLKYKRSYYGGNNDANSHEMVIEAAQQLAKTTDFSQYDLDNNGVIDNLYIIYAGQGEADGGEAETVWPHSWELSAAGVNLSFNGKKLDGYACSNEIDSKGNPAGIGNICHEFSHVMGLPDLYSTGEEELTCTPFSYTLMDYGCYNNDTRTPPNYSALERNAMGWITLEELKEPATIELEHLGASNKAYYISTSGSKEFFIIENRQQEGWDKYLDGHGMLVWHLDFVQSVWNANTVNNNKQHQYVDLIKANKSTSYLSTAFGEVFIDPDNIGGFPFPGVKGVTSLTATTSPALVDWNKKGVDVPLTNISENGLLLSFDVSGGYVELDTPEAPSVSANERGQLLLKWQPVDKATAYAVTVSSGEGDSRHILEPYSDFNVGNVTEYTIEGIEAMTTYTASVRALRGKVSSDLSAESATVSPELDFIYTAPVALPSFASASTANLQWRELKGAAKYLLTVEAETDGGTTDYSSGFGSSQSTSIPGGWSFSLSASNVYKSAPYIGKAAPALKFSKNEASLTTCVYDNPVRKVSFWLVGAGITDNASSTFVVNGRSDSSAAWKTLHTVDNLDNYNSDGKMIEVSVEGDICQLQFVYNKDAAGNIGFDDVTITTDSRRYVVDMDKVDVGNVTSYNYTKAAGTSNVRFFVTGVDAGGRVSKDSAKMDVKEQDAVGEIEMEGIEDAPVYYNLQGMRVAHPAAGIYIVRRGSKVSKEAIN